MPHTFRARVASVRITPSRSEDADTVERVLLEAHDTEVDPLRELIDHEVYVTLAEAPLRRTPMEEAIDQVPANGRVDAAVPVSTGRRRRGTKATPTEGE
jgi:hypothetical protein